MSVALLLTAAVAVWVAINAIGIVLQRRSAASTLAWLFALVFLPVLGLAAYWIIGPLRLERRKRRRTRSKRILAEGVRGLAALDVEAAQHHQLAQVAIGLGEPPPLRADAVDLYFDGVSAYKAIFDAIAVATNHVHLEYYIWEPDTIGTRLRDLLVERARAGVTVRVILDGTGSGHISKKFLAPLREAGAVVAWFNPVRLWTLRRRRADFRSHRKIVVCDGRVGFTGGMNITDAHTAELSKDYWRDTHLRVTGTAVWAMQRLFFEDWYFVADELLPVTDDTLPSPVHDGSHLVQVIGSGPDATTFAIQKVMFTAINRAATRIWLTTPYFVPDEALLTALVTAALRGVDVRVLVPKRGDSRLVDLAARSYFPELLEANVHVYEYEARFIHAKTLVCDDDIAIVGTANFDNRSFRLDFELAAIAYGHTANIELAGAFERDLTDSREIRKGDFAKQSFLHRLGEASARLLSPLL